MTRLWTRRATWLAVVAVVAVVVALLATAAVTAIPAAFLAIDLAVFLGLDYVGGGHGHEVPVGPAAAAAHTANPVPVERGGCSPPRSW